MHGFWWAAACALLISLLAGLIRTWKGPRPTDRMLAGQLFGSTGVAILLVLAEATDTAALRDVALVLALLAILAVVAFINRLKVNRLKVNRLKDNDNENVDDKPKDKFL